MEDRSGRGVEVVATGHIGPGVPPLGHLVVPEGRDRPALRALRVLPVRRAAGPLEVVQAGVVIWELAGELA